MQPSPIKSTLKSACNSNLAGREEEDDFLNFCKKRPLDDANQSNNAGENKTTTDAGAIFRSVTADDENAPIASDANADFSTAILMGNYLRPIRMRSSVLPLLRPRCPMR